MVVNDAAGSSLPVRHIRKMELVVAGKQPVTALFEVVAPSAGDCEVRVYDESGVYQGRVPGPTAKDQLLQCFFGMGKDDATTNINVSTKLTRTNDDDVELRAWSMDENDMVKNVFAPVTLKRISTDGKELLGLSMYLVDHAVQQSTKMKSIHDRAKDWQATAEDLEGGWEKEKTKLFGNFLRLYNGRQDELRDALQRVSHLEGEKKNLQAELEAVTEQIQKQKRSPALDYSHVPDDQQSMDLDEAARLAKGPARKRKAQSTKSETTIKSIKRTLGADDTEEGWPSKHLNPFTGAYEYDGDAVVDDDDLFPEQKVADPKEESQSKRKSTKKRAAEHNCAKKADAMPKNDDESLPEGDHDFQAELLRLLNE